MLNANVIDLIIKKYARDRNLMIGYSLPYHTIYAEFTSLSNRGFLE